MHLIIIEIIKINYKLIYIILNNIIIINHIVFYIKIYKNT